MNFSGNKTERKSSCLNGWSFHCGYHETELEEIRRLMVDSGIPVESISYDCIYSHKYPIDPGEYECRQDIHNGDYVINVETAGNRIDEIYYRPYGNEIYITGSTIY